MKTKYLVKTENQIYECKDVDELEKKTSALTVLGFNFDIYELTKIKEG